MNSGNLGAVQLERGDFLGAVELQRTALVITRSLGDDMSAVNALRNLAGAYLALGDLERATEEIEAAVAIGDRIGAKRLTGIGRLLRSRIALAEGDLALAARRQTEGASTVHGCGDRSATSGALGATAELDGQLGDAALAVRLLGASDSIQRSPKARWTPA